MRNKIVTMLGVICIALLWYGPISASAQQMATSAQTKYLVRTLENDTDRFHKSLTGSLRGNVTANVYRRAQVNAMVDELEFATDQLRRRVDDNVVIRPDIKNVLQRGLRIDMFMTMNKLSPAAERDWSSVRETMDRLARSFGLTWVWEPEKNFNQASTRQLVRRLEQNTDQFKDSFDNALDKSRLDGSGYEDFMNNVVATFDDSVDKLKSEADDQDRLDQTDLRTTLNNAVAIDDFLVRNKVNERTRRDWARVKSNLDDLALVTQMKWTWNSNATRGASASMQGATGVHVGLASSPSANALAREVRHELLSDLPYYNVFDWIQFEVQPNNTVVLEGAVTTPPDTKSRAEDVVKDISGVTRVVNNIRVLPVSPNDNRLRRRLYNEIYGFDSPLFRYAIGSRQSIHIIVEGGRATLKGVVDNAGDKQLAYTRARSVPGLFGVTNDLKVSPTRMEMIR